MQGKGAGVGAGIPSSGLRAPAVRAPVLGIMAAASLPASPCAKSAAAVEETVCAGGKGLGLGVLPPLGRRVRGVSEGSMAEAVVLSVSVSESLVRVGVWSRARAREMVGGLGREEEGMLCGGWWGGLGEGRGCGFVEGGVWGMFEGGLGRGFLTGLRVALRVVAWMERRTDGCLWV